MIESDSITPFELEDIMAHEMNNMLRSLTMLPPPVKSEPTFLILMDPPQSCMFWLNDEKNPELAVHKRQSSYFKIATINEWKSICLPRWDYKKGGTEIGFSLFSFQVAIWCCEWSRFCRDQKVIGSKRSWSFQSCWIGLSLLMEG